MFTLGDRLVEDVLFEFDTNAMSFGISGQAGVIFVKRTVEKQIAKRT